ncbi:hypothetical protein H0V99_00870 [Candidatus Saccharibacteria bacterium]|nr:hypothetical protein [Candidatus Saccharibacteria bacterium]
MKKYYIGLIILSVLVLGLAGYVISLGMLAKQDKKTEKRVGEISEKLNNYISDEDEIPESLDKAGITGVPSTIKFEKLSDEKYKFCVTYQADKGYGSGSITSVLTEAAYGGMYSDAYESNSENEKSYLYMPYTHTKGETCQTIKPNIYSSPSRFNNSEPELDYNTYLEDLCSTDSASDTYSTSEICAPQENDIPGTDEL